MINHRTFRDKEYATIVPLRNRPHIYPSTNCKQIAQYCLTTICFVFWQAMANSLNWAFCVLPDSDFSLAWGSRDDLPSLQKRRVAWGGKLARSPLHINKARTWEEGCTAVCWRDGTWPTSPRFFSLNFTHILSVSLCIGWPGNDWVLKWSFDWTGWSRLAGSNQMIETLRTGFTTTSL